MRCAAIVCVSASADGPESVPQNTLAQGPATPPGPTTPCQEARGARPRCVRLTAGARLQALARRGGQPLPRHRAQPVRATSEGSGDGCLERGGGPFGLVAVPSVASAVVVVVVVAGTDA